MVPLGTGGLSVVLMWEEESLPVAAFGHGTTVEDEERPAWAFQTLDQLPDPKQTGKLWHPTLRQALEAVAAALHDGYARRFGDA